MRVGFVLDPLPQLREPKDTSILMMRAAAAAGHEVHAIPFDSVAFADGGMVFDDLLLGLSDGPDWHQVRGHTPGARPGSLDVIVMRKDPPFGSNALRRVQILAHAAANGTPVHNSPSALLRHDEKLLALRHPALVPDTLVTSDPGEIRAFHRAHGGCVVKPLGRMGGSGVYLSPEDDGNLGSVVDMLGGPAREMLIVQERVAAARDGDKRVIVIDGRPEPHMLRRLPADGDFRGNLAAGARAVAEPLGETERAIALEVAKTLVEEGILLAGLDILGDRLGEVNITSPTCMREIRDQTGHNSAEEFVRCLEALPGLR